MSNNPILLAALRYLGRGFSVIPVAKTKKPLIEWAEFQTRRPTPVEIQGWWDKWPDANVGIVTGKLSGLTVIDCDSDAGITRVAQLGGKEWAGAPTVKTSRGIQYYCKFDERAVNRHTVVEDVDIRSEGGFVVAPPSVHASGKTYAWVEPFTLDTTALAFVPAGLLGCATCAPGAPPAVKREGAVATAFTVGKRHDSLLHVLKCAAEGGLEKDWLIDLGRRLALSCSPPYPEKQLSTEVQGIVEWVTKKERNLAAEVRDWVLHTTGSFSTTDLYRGLQVLDRASQKAAVVALTRLKEEGVIEKFGVKNGVFRRVERDVVRMDWRAAEVKTFDISWPLFIGSYFVTYPKNLCIFAGYKDSGKTTIALEIVKRNMKKHDVRYINNEMSAEELKMRLLKHEDTNINDWTFEAIERNDDYEAVVDPNGLNIIDYIEPGEEVYKIGTTLRRIHEKLDKGIAVIMLQKKRRQVLKTGGTAGELGYGAEFTLLRPRLYITLDPGMARVVSAKNRAPGVEHSPVGKVMPYKIVQGWKVIPDSTEWVSEDALKQVQPGRLY